MIMEFSHVPNPVLRQIYDAYSLNIIPHLGNMFAGDADSYKYLVESIRRFPQQEELLGMMREAGFGAASYRNLTFGITCIHSGYKL